MYVCRVGRLNIGQELIGFGLQGGTVARNHGCRPFLPEQDEGVIGRAEPELHSINLSWDMQAGDIGSTEGRITCYSDDAFWRVKHVLRLKQ